MVQTERAFIVGLSGPTGAGKSSIGQLLARRPAVTLVPEPDPGVRLSETLQRETHSVEEIERWIVRERQLRSKQVVQNASSDDTVIIDRVPAEDRDVFFRLHYEAKLIDGASLARLGRFFDVEVSDQFQPNIIIFVTADEATIKARISLVLRQNGYVNI